MIPSGLVSLPLSERRNVDPDRQLGHAGLERHHGEADHHRADPEPGRQAGSGPDEHIRSSDQQDQAPDNLQPAGHRGSLRNPLPYA
jgi:hypothetical protein